MNICICASIAFYDHFESVVGELENLGHKVSFPTLEGGDKTDAMRTHFQKIEDADAILVLNYEKNGTPNYIGANVFLEIGYAFALRMHVFLLNDLPTHSPYQDELAAMNVVALRGDLSNIPS